MRSIDLNIIQISVHFIRSQLRVIFFPLRLTYGSLTMHFTIIYVFRKGQIANLFGFFRVMMNRSIPDPQFHLKKISQSHLLFHYIGNRSKETWLCLGYRHMPTLEMIPKIPYHFESRSGIRICVELWLPKPQQEKAQPQMKLNSSQQHSSYCLVDFCHLMSVKETTNIMRKVQISYNLNCIFV